jgi:hypothetical protein
MRISLITAMMLVSSAAVATATGWQASANAQQQPTIQVPVPNIPGITTPSQPQQRPYYPPGQEPYPPQGQPYQGQPYQGQGGYRGVILLTPARATARISRTGNRTFGVNWIMPRRPGNNTIG